MADTEQLDLLASADMPERIQTLVTELLTGYTQPSANELLAYVEEKLGWSARWDLKEVLGNLADDRSLTSSMREYLGALLESGDLDEALRGPDVPDREVVSTIDALVKQSKNYRNSKAFGEMVDFMARFRDYAPFNNMLVRVQNPSCSFYASARDWNERFKRTPKEDARPMLILAPMHPVMLVYDLDQTEGEPVPEELLKYAKFEGEYDPDWMSQMLDNAKGHRIKVGFKTLSATNAGFATTARETGEWKMRIAIHDGLDEPSRLGVLCHELAHILLGHLGTDRDLWWPSRSNLTRQTVEIEAESVAYIVTSRLGLKGSSAAYVCGHLRDGNLPESVSLDLIAKVAGTIEKMARESVPPKKPKPVAGRRRNQ